MSTIPTVLLSGALALALHFSGLRNANPLLYQALYKGIALALTEETVKFLTFRRVIQKNGYPYSWLDFAALMAIVGLGFGASENLVEALDSGFMVMLIRALTLPHGGYGFVMGYFYGKGEKTGSKAHKTFGFALVWLLHGLYDFSLSEEFLALNENLAIIAVSLAFLDLVLVIVLVVFFAKARRKALYMQPLCEAVPGGAPNR